MPSEMAGRPGLATHRARKRAVGEAGQGTWPCVRRSVSGGVAPLVLAEHFTVFAINVEQVDLLEQTADDPAKASFIEIAGRVVDGLKEELERDFPGLRAQVIGRGELDTLDPVAADFLERLTDAPS